MLAQKKFPMRILAKMAAIDSQNFSALMLRMQKLVADCKPNSKF
ncbi:hypothetical protein QUB77_26780 [Microcoleus sp. AT9b-C3]